MARLKPKMRIQMLIVVGMACVIIGGCFAPWIINKVSSDLFGTASSASLDGAHFLKVLFDTKENFASQEIVIKGLLAADATKAATSTIMFCVAGSLFGGMLLFVTGTLGFLFRSKMMLSLSKFLSFLMILIGIIGTICAYVLIDKMGVDIPKNALVNVSKATVAPFLVGGAGIISMISCMLVRKRRLV